MPSVCNECSVGCNINIEFRNNEVLRLTARANPAVDEGWLCDHGRFTYDYVNSKDRLTQPLVRRNGELQPASWDEALDLVANRLGTLARESEGSAVGGVISARATNEELYLFQKLFRGPLGSGNVDHWPRTAPVVGPFGVDALHGSIAALERAGAILLVGLNPVVEQPILDLRLKKAVRQGATLIVVSAEPINLDQFAAHALRVTPAALPALLGAWANLLVTDGLYDAGFVNERTTGLDQLREHLASYTIERATQETGLPAATIAAVGQALVERGPAALLFHRALANTNVLDALVNLGLLTGATKEDGIFGGLVSESNGQGALDLGIVPAGDAWGATRANSARGLYLLGLDPLGKEADALPGGATALDGIEFLVVQDLFLTETARRADVVLPAVSWAEKDGTITNLERRVQRLRPAVHAPGDARPDWRALRDLGRRLAPEGGFSFTSPPTVWQQQAAQTPTNSPHTNNTLALGGPH
ncbi:MAG: molybdopterin oxidoreductase family protein, partial [Thermomicrobiales bacterium]